MSENREALRETGDMTWEDWEREVIGADEIGAVLRCPMSISALWTPDDIAAEYSNYSDDDRGAP